MAFLSASLVAPLWAVKSTVVKYKVYACTLKPQIVKSYYEALVLNQMVEAAAGHNCYIEVYIPKQ